MMAPEVGIEDMVFTEIVGNHEVCCDYAERDWHGPARAAEWIGVLSTCACGMGGVRLICDPCHDMLLVDEEAAFECRHCGLLTYPPLLAFARMERL